MRTLALALALSAASPAMAQDVDWFKAYKTAKAGHAVAYVAPVAAVGVTVGMVAAANRAKTKFGKVLIIVVAVAIVPLTGVMTAPLMSWSAMRGRRAVNELGGDVGGAFGTASWVGNATVLGGVGMMVASDELVGAGLLTVVAGGLLTYGAGELQWSANRRGWRSGPMNDLPSERSRPPFSLTIGGRW